jgi:hypothetical protein
MDVHGKSLDVVPCDVLKRFNKQEIESVVRVEISDGAVLLADNGDIYVWPEKDALISGKSFESAVGYEFGLRITTQFKNPFQFFQPLGLYLSVKKKPLTVHLDVLDPVVKQLGTLNINYMWEYVYYTYQEFNSWGVVFSSALHVDVSPAAYRRCGLNISLAEYWNLCYQQFVQPEVSLVFELKHRDAATLFGSYLTFDVMVDRYVFTHSYQHENSIWIDNCEFKCKDDRHFVTLDMPVVVAESFLEQLLKEKDKFKLIFKSEKDKLLWCEPNERYICSNKHGWPVWRRKTRHTVLVDICMSLSFFNMPYVVNDIVLWLDEFAHITQYERMAIIEPVFASLRKVWQTREQTAKEIKTA